MVKIPSRLMPQYRAGNKKGYYLLGIIVLIGFLAACYYSPQFVVILSALAIALFAWGFAEQTRYKSHFKKMYDKRKSLSICDFAKEFDCKLVDTWVIRATYEQVQNELGLEYAFPLRGADRLKDDLLLDDDDIDLDLVEEIAHRTGRTLDDIESNPLMGKVYTVRDLALLFNHQALTNPHSKLITDRL